MLQSMAETLSIQGQGLDSKEWQISHISQN